MQTVSPPARGLLALLLGAASLCAQCFDPNTGNAIGTGDDVVLPAQSLPFAFPFHGATYTTVHACTNGFVYLGNGTATANPLCCNGDATNLAAAANPMLAPWWSDLDYPTGNGEVRFQASATTAVITWRNAFEIGSSQNTDLFTVQLQLHASGDFDFVYDARVAVRSGHAFLAGMSPGGGAATGPASTFAIAGFGATDTNYQLFGPGNGPVPLAGTAVHFTPTNPGFVWTSTNCTASHTSFGTGCYNLAASFYQFTTAPSAVTAMSNSSIALVRTATGYTVLPAAVPYLPPSPGASVLALGDDSETTVALGSAFPYAGGTTTSLTVCSNGFVSVAPGNGTGFAPSAATMLAAPQTGWWAWKDYDPSIAGGGGVKYQMVGSIACITWDGVWDYLATSAANANTFQFQFDTATGNVAYVWQQMTTGQPSTSADHLVGYSPGGASLDPGPITLPTSLPLATWNADQAPLTLSAAPPPVSTPSTGTVVTYTTSQIPEYGPGVGLHIAIHTLSLGQLTLPGLDLGFVGAPGCALLVPTFDLSQVMVGAGSTQSVTLPIPPGVPAGFLLFSQAAAVIAPDSLPNGQNALGLTTSNALRSLVNPQ